MKSKVTGKLDNFDKILVKDMKMGDKGILIDSVLQSNNGRYVMMTYRNILVDLESGGTWSPKFDDNFYVRLLRPGENILIEIVG